MIDQKDLMDAAWAAETQIRSTQLNQTVRNPAIARMVADSKSAPKVSQALLAEMTRRGYKAADLAQLGLGPDNVRVLARTINNRGE